MKVTNLFTEKDREVFDRIDRDCLAMHVVPPPKTFLKLEVRDAAGELNDVYQDRAHSWVRNAYNYFGCQTLFVAPSENRFGAGSLARKSTSGSVTTSGGLWNTGNPTDVIGGSGVATQGILVGTGATAESFESFSLATKIANGNSAGQLAYNAQPATALSYDAGAKKMTSTMTRVFNNNSGGDIVVSEVGIFNNDNTMFCRDLLAEAKTIPNAGQLTVTYTIEMTFPE